MENLKYECECNCGCGLEIEEILELLRKYNARHPETVNFGIGIMVAFFDDESGHLLATLSNGEMRKICIFDDIEQLVMFLKEK